MSELDTTILVLSTLNLVQGPSTVSVILHSPIEPVKLEATSASSERPCSVKVEEEETKLIDYIEEKETICKTPLSSCLKGTKSESSGPQTVIEEFGGSRPTSPKFRAKGEEGYIIGRDIIHRLAGPIKYVIIGESSQGVLLYHLFGISFSRDIVFWVDIGGKHIIYDVDQVHHNGADVNSPKAYSLCICSRWYHWYSNDQHVLYCDQDLRWKLHDNIDDAQREHYRAIEEPTNPPCPQISQASYASNTNSNSSCDVPDPTTLDKSLSGCDQVAPSVNSAPPSPSVIPGATNNVDDSTATDHDEILQPSRGAGRDEVDGWVESLNRRKKLIKLPGEKFECPYEDDQGNRTCNATPRHIGKVKEHLYGKKHFDIQPFVCKTCGYTSSIKDNVVRFQGHKTLQGVKCSNPELAM